MTPHPTHEVLVVDPDDEGRAHLTLFLQMHGCRVVATRAPDDTLQILRDGFRPCVVLTDPRECGPASWELVDYLRADSVLATVPLILIAREPMQMRCAHWRGVRACIAQPAAPASFVDAVERHCRRRRGRIAGPPVLDPRADRTSLRPFERIHTKEAS